MEVNIAIDSNRYTDLIKGDKAALETLERATSVLVPLIVLAELRAGFACGSKRQENERVLVQFLNTSGVSVLYPDESTTLAYAELFRDLRKAGKPVPTNDLWIAALCIQHNLVLFARDRHFDLISRLARTA